MSSTTQPEVDAVVVGAGFAGMRTIHSLRQRNLSMRVFEAGSDVGGTWYWNRYPGARTDTESWAYCFSFDKDLCQQWDWPERFPKQPDVLKYLSHVADKHDFRRDISFSTRVTGATWDDESATWTVTTDTGESVTCRWLITGLGWLGIAYKPGFKGLDDFQGEWYQTSLWPKEPVDLDGKRVAVIGTGATGIQVIQTIAPAVEHLTVFQRTPNFVMPGRNHALSDEQRTGIKRDYDAIWEKTFNHVFAFPMDPANRLGSTLSDEELDEVFQAGWESGGFRYIFETVDDMLVDQRVNDAAAEFVRKKIRAIVKDPDIAETLSPRTHPIGGKRPPLGNFYYETFNRENVTLVNVRKDPILEITPTGVRTESGVHEVDVIIFATGFDAITGPLEKMNIRGVGGRKLEEDWAEGPQLHLGISAHGYPNMFTILGPQGPFASHPPVIETQVEFIAKVLDTAIAEGAQRVEATAEACQAFSDLCDAILGMTLIPQGMDDRPWFLGANVPGKKPSTLAFLGGMAAYNGELAKDTDGGFPGYARTSVTVPA